MYMYANEIAFIILQRVYAACVWEYKKNQKKNQEDIHLHQ
jgi:hypothetical protein